MKRLFRYFWLPLVALPACAHMPADLGAWAQDKALRVASCAAQELVTRGDARACIGPRFIKDLGTEACEQAHKLLESLPAEDKEGR